MSKKKVNDVTLDIVIFVLVFMIACTAAYCSFLWNLDQFGESFVDGAISASYERSELLGRDSRTYDGYALGDVLGGVLVYYMFRFCLSALVFCSLFLTLIKITGLQKRAIIKIAEAEAQT